MGKFTVLPKKGGGREGICWMFSQGIEQHHTAGFLEVK